MAWLGQEMPGDILALASEGMGEGKPIWDRMCVIISARRFDVRQLMAGFDTRNRGFFDQATFARALANAFGNQWVELAMTTPEFQQVCNPYLTRKPADAGIAGAPESLVLWHQFAADLQKMAETRQPADGFLARLAAVEERERLGQMLQQEYSVTEPELKLAFKYFKDRISVYSKRGLTDGFRRIDKDNKGTLCATEIMQFFHETHGPYYVNERTIAVLVDWADLNGDDEISYEELSAVLQCDDLLQMLALVPDKKAVSQEKKERERIVNKERGVSAQALRDAQEVVVNRFLERFPSARQALAFLDADGSGAVSREEFKTHLKGINLLSHKEKKTGRVVKGAMTTNEADALLDAVDIISTSMGGRSHAYRIDLTAFARIFEKDANGHTVDILELAGL